MKNIKIVLYSLFIAISLSLSANSPAKIKSCCVEIELPVVIGCEELIVDPCGN